MSTYLGNSKVSPTISGDIEVKYAFTDDGSVGGDVSNVKSVSVNGAPLGDGQTRLYVEVGDGETVTLQIGRNDASARVLVIDWGDGNIEEYTVGYYFSSFPGLNTYLSKTHTYTTAGKYAIVPVDTKADAANRFRFGIQGTSISNVNKQVFAAEIGLNKNGDGTLGTSSFQYTDIKSVYIQDGVQMIPPYSFSYIRNNAIVINWTDSITSVGGSAFDTGHSSYSVSFTNFSCKNLQSVESYAFRYTNINEAIFEQPDCTIANNAFQFCKQLKKIYFPRNITTIPNFVCYNCDGGLEIDMPDTVTTIGNSAFYYAKGALIKKMPSNLITIGNDALSGNTNAAVLPSNRFINFNGITALPDTITTIGDYAFRNAANLFLTKLPDSLTTLGQYAFSSTEIAITSIPSGVTVIPNYCFRYCPNITNITLHANITSINTGAFSDCSQLESVTVLATTPPTLGGTVFYNNKSTRKIYVPAASLEAYKSATNWSAYASYMEAIPA